MKYCDTRKTFSFMIFLLFNFRNSLSYFNQNTEQPNKDHHGIFFSFMGIFLFSCLLQNVRHKIIRKDYKKRNNIFIVNFLIGQHEVLINESYIMWGFHIDGMYDHVLNKCSTRFIQVIIHIVTQQCLQIICLIKWFILLPSR